MEGLAGTFTVGHPSASYRLREHAQRTILVIPQCRDFTSVVTSALRAAATSACPDQMSRILATMQNPNEVSLRSMPVIESSVSSLIVSPDEALRECVHCPNIECRSTDELLSCAYSHCKPWVSSRTSVAQLWTPWCRPTDRCGWLNHPCLKIAGSI